MKMKKRDWIVLLLWILPLASPARSAAQEDLTSLFKKYYDIESEKKGPNPPVLLHKNEIDNLKEFKILLIPGYFSSVAINFTPVKYFDSAMEMLKNRGFKEGEDFERLVLYSQASTTDNLSLISSAIKDSPKKVLIIGHSKGSTDSLKALLQDPELQKNVGGFISIQGPFKGTQVADGILESTFWQYSFSLLLRVLNGNLNSLLDFSTDEGRNFMDKYAKAIAELPFPVISFSSSLKEDQGMSFSPLSLLHGILKRKDIPSDGIVPTDSALLPGGHCQIIYEGMDHIDPVVSLGKRGKRKAFLESLLKTFIDKFLPQV